MSMYRCFCKWVTSCLCLFLGGQCCGAELKVVFDGQLESGTAYLALYDGSEKQGWNSEPVKLAHVSISVGSSLAISLSNLPEGRYAARAYIDLNNNQTLDLNGMGIPTEPFAISGQIGNGKPSRRFTKSLFFLAKGENELRLNFIQVQNSKAGFVKKQE